MCERLKAAALANGCTLFQAVIAVFHIWQHRWTRRDEVGLGVTLTGRHHPALEKLIGNFQQSSCVRTNLHGTCIQAWPEIGSRNVSDAET